VRAKVNDSWGRTQGENPRKKKIFPLQGERAYAQGGPLPVDPKTRKRKENTKGEKERLPLLERREGGGNGPTGQKKRMRNRFRAPPFLKRRGEKEQKRENGRGGPHHAGRKKPCLAIASGGSSASLGFEGPCIRKRRTRKERKSSRKKKRRHPSCLKGGELSHVSSLSKKGKRKSKEVGNAYYAEGKNL